MARAPYAVAVAPERKKYTVESIPGFEKTVFAITIVQMLWSAYKFVNAWWQRQNVHVVVVGEQDPMYSEVHKWLLEVLPEEKTRSIEVVSAGSKSRRGLYESSPETTDGEKIKPLEVRFNDKTDRTVDIDGHKIIVSLSTPDADDMRIAMRYDVYAKIQFTAKSHAGQQAIRKKLEEINQQRATKRKATLKMMDQWSNWRTRSDLPPRTMKSVALPSEQKDRIVTDLRNFLGAEDEYARLALPWHRGYMLYGPPGTGKTSLVKALANEFNLDLWYVSLSDLKAESGLLSLLADVGPRSMLLLEDIDTIRITHDRDASDAGEISMGSLLNILDGVATPHGLITFMTTNRFDILDPALTRAGRMDLIEELGYPSKSIVREMFEHFYDDTTPLIGIKENDFSSRKISTSQISEIMKRHLTDPDKALIEIKDLLK